MHRNFVHLVLAVRTAIVFGVGFAVIGPLRCCVHSPSVYGDRRLMTDVKVRSPIDASNRDIMIKGTDTGYSSRWSLKPKIAITTPNGY